MADKKTKFTKRGDRIFTLDGPKKDEGSAKVIVEIDESKVEVEVRVNSNFKSIRYELTSEAEINPLDACYCLWIIINNACKEIGIDFDEFVKNYAAIAQPDDGEMH